MGIDNALLQRQSRRGRRADAHTHEVIIIGAGFGGLAMGIRLKQDGVEDFVIIERAQEAGGTWRDNRYPGCACDAPSLLYSYSFEQNPDWTRTFAGSEEIQQYILRCVEKYRLRPHIRFGHGVERAVWDEHAGIWQITDDAGHEYRARAVVSAVGGLVNPSYPDIPGLASFSGNTLHTARWDHGVDLRGKRVAVIGTGASAVQLVPAIQPEVAQLTVFQRTPHWVLPKPDWELSATTKKVFRRFPLLQQAARTGVYAFTDFVMGPAIVYDTPLTHVMEALGRRHIAQQISDPALRRKVTPNFRFGCKRMLITSDYYPALAKANVDVCTGGIAQVEHGGIRTRDGKLHECDVIALATGYRLDIARAPFEVIGRDGKTLNEAWSGADSRAYRGVAVTGFPNWFVLMGPNTGPGHTSVLVYTEAQVNYIAQGIERIVQRGVHALMVKASAQRRYGEFLRRRLARTNWASGCTSWYLDEHGNNHSMYPGLVSEYVLGVRKFRDADYEFVRAGTQGANSRIGNERVTA